jgi:hypothetical protein
MVYRNRYTGDTGTSKYSGVLTCYYFAELQIERYYGSLYIVTFISLLLHIHVLDVVHVFQCWSMISKPLQGTLYPRCTGIMNTSLANQTTDIL